LLRYCGKRRPVASSANPLNWLKSSKANTVSKCKNAKPSIIYQKHALTCKKICLILEAIQILRYRYCYVSYAIMLRATVVVIMLVASLYHGAFAQQREAFIPFINSEHAWVDSVFRTLTNRDKVAQLFMVRAHSNLGQR